MATEGVGFLARLGARAGRRAEPRLWISLAGAGCALAVAGVVIISGDAQVGDEGFSDGSRVPGIILCLVVAAAGYVLLRLFTESPAATAGVTAIALAVPPLFYFLTFDGDGTPPWSAEGILALSALVWLVSYVVGPARGRPLLLGAGLFAVVLLAFQLTEEPFSAGLDEGAFVDQSRLCPASPSPATSRSRGARSSPARATSPKPRSWAAPRGRSGSRTVVLVVRPLDGLWFRGSAAPFTAVISCRQTGWDRIPGRRRRTGWCWCCIRSSLGWSWPAGRLQWLLGIDVHRRRPG